MERWFTPVLFFVGAGVVAYYNAGHTSSQLLFPGTHLVPGYENDMFAQGRLTWQLFAGVGAVTTVTAIVGMIRARRRTEDA